MRKKILAISLLALILLFGYFVKTNSTYPDNGEVFLGKDTGEYLGSFYEGNYVWGGAMNLAWNELGTNIIDEKPQLVTEDAVVQRMVSTLNNAAFNRNDLDKDSYYIKSGYGQRTVDLINKEVRAAFPSKSFADVKIDLLPRDVIAYAYFLKDVKYAKEFKETMVTFQHDLVKGFYASTSEQKEVVRVMQYWNDNKFIIALQLKDKEDQLILAKGFDMDSPQNIVDVLRTFDTNEYPSMKSADLFEMPKLHLDLRRNYEELIGGYFANEGFSEYKIGAMYERIKFDMDEEGARVENEGVIVARFAASMYSPEIEKRKFSLDEPFWVILKQVDSNNPYFILGVNNTEVMERN